MVDQALLDAPAQRKGDRIEPVIRAQHRKGHNREVVWEICQT